MLRHRVIVSIKRRFTMEAAFSRILVLFTLVGLVIGTLRINREFVFLQSKSHYS